MRGLFKKRKKREEQESNSFLVSSLVFGKVHKHFFIVPIDLVSFLQSIQADIYIYI